MNVEFNWWLLLVGLAGGAALTWLILADLSRREPSRPPGSDADEVTWIASVLDDEATSIETAVVERILELHRSWDAEVEETADVGPAEPRPDEQADDPALRADDPAAPTG